MLFHVFFSVSNYLTRHLSVQSTLCWSIAQKQEKRESCSLFYFVNFSACNTVVQIDKAKAICECLIASEGNDLKIAEAFCLFLLGQV